MIQPWREAEGRNPRKAGYYLTTPTESNGMAQSHPCRVLDYDIFPWVTICDLTHGLNIASLQDFGSAISPTA